MFFTTWRDRLDAVPNFARLILAVLLIQLLFWLLVKPLVIGSPTPSFDTIEGYDFAQAELATPTYTAVQSAEFEAIEEMPAWHCCEVGYRAFRYQFDIEKVPPSGLGLAPHVRADNYAAYVNGVQVGGTGRLSLPDHTYDSLLRTTYLVPASVLQSGSNEVTFVMVREGIPYFDYFPPVLGEYNHIKQNMERSEFLTGGYSYIVASAIAMVALFSLIFFLISGRDGGAFWLFILSTALALISHYYLWTDPPFDGHFRVAYFFAVSLLVQFAWFGWANSWSRDSYRWPMLAASAVFVIALCATAYALAAMPYGAGYDRAGDVLFYSGVVFAVATSIRLLWNFRDLKEDRYWEAAIALLLVALLAFQVVTEFTSDLNMGYVTRAQPFLIIGIAIAFFARRVTLFRSSEQINALLQSQLDERTSELAVAHNREKRLVRQQALDEERQRIMRDMHDGLGSHLMSMMMMAKRGNGTHSDYAEGLQSVIDEMRLMIDSMDSVGESLRSALAVFKKRVVPRAREAGFDVEWNDEAAPEMPALNPREVLQVFRILQEALNNALKHSGGDRVSVHVRCAPDDPSTPQICVQDNGKGTPERSSMKAGRGLKNMQARASGIGAGFDVSSDRLGTAVTLTLKSSD